MIGSLEQSMTKQKLEEQVSNAIFYIFIQHYITNKRAMLWSLGVGQKSSKWLKTWFLSQNGQFLTKRGPKTGQKKFIRILNFLFVKKSKDLVHITKISKIISTDRKKMAKNLIFHHKQCIFNQKRAKKSNFRFFPMKIFSPFF